MLKSELTTMPAYFDQYINMCDDVSIEVAIEKSITEITPELIEKWKILEDKIYAPNKWTVKEILQHTIDTERIFTYRALAYSRNETQAVISFDEDLYAKNSNANTRSVDEIVEELIIVHKSTLSLFKSFTKEMLHKNCIGFKGLYSVASVGFMMPGHQRWHLKVLEERYYSLI